jgi:hypothetical protein
MLSITFDPNTLSGAQKEWWDKWFKDARAARARAIEAWEERPANAASAEIPIPASIWTRLKDELLKTIFHNKCAYCETPNSPRYPVEVEHFRPKGEVTCGKKPAVVAQAFDERGKFIDHPGYFWTAFDWRNLLPCCKRCNSGKGKGTQFPLTPKSKYVLAVKLTPTEVKKLKAAEDAVPSATHPGMYYLAPPDLDAREDRLLVHPYYDPPDEHLQYKVKGLEVSLTERGQSTIEVFDLGDVELRRCRQKAQERAQIAISAKVAVYVDEDEDLELEEAYRRARANFRATAVAKPYSKAVLDALEATWELSRPH